MYRNSLSAFIIFFISFTAVGAVAVPGPLVESDWLGKNKANVVILDVRKDIKSFTKKPVYRKDKKSGKQKLIRVGGHIPGARLVNYKYVRESKIIDGKKVTRVIPPTKNFEEYMQVVGLNKNDTVIIVSKGESNGDMTMATRLYWQLKYYGHTNMAILNGGTAQWILDKRKLSFKNIEPKEGNWVAAIEDAKIFASSKNVAQAVNSKDTQLIDTRSVSLYLGTFRKAYVYNKGHIEGAKNYPNELMTKPSLPVRFISKDNTRALMTHLGIDTTSKSITYCNSGHLASGSWFLLSEVMGNKNVKLYDGSMHQWTVEKRPTVSVTSN